MKFASDVIFIDRKKRVRKIVPGLAPWRMAWCLAAHSVLELPLGVIRSTGTKKDRSGGVREIGMRRLVAGSALLYATAQFTGQTGLTPTRRATGAAGWSANSSRVIGSVPGDGERGWTRARSDQAMNRVGDEPQFIHPALASGFYTVTMQVRAGRERSKPSTRW